MTPSLVQTLTPTVLVSDAGRSEMSRRPFPYWAVRRFRRLSGSQASPLYSARRPPLRITSPRCPTSSVIRFDSASLLRCGS